MPIQVTQSSMPSIEEYINEIKSIWETKRLTNVGEKHIALEEKLKNYLSVSNISLFSNGHSALELAIQGLKLKGEVITTPFTFASTTHAIIRCGLTPVFCDINEEEYTINADKIEKLITDKTSAILPVHVYGNICDVEKINIIAKKNRLKVIYDAAHAFGEEYKGIPIGNFGDITMFSFHSTKVFHTIEGGALCYTSQEYSEKLSSLRNFGITSPEKVSYVGTNAKMNEFEAAMGICNLRHIDEEILKRQIVFEHYMENLEGIEGLSLPNKNTKVKKNYAYLPILVDKNLYGKTRDELLFLLEEEQIFTRKYFFPLTNSLECYKGSYNDNNTPVAKDIANKVLVLPLYSNLSLDSVTQICRIIKER